MLSKLKQYGNIEKVQYVILSINNFSQIFFQNKSNGKKIAFNIVEDSFRNSCQGGWYDGSRSKILVPVLQLPEFM